MAKKRKRKRGSAQREASGGAGPPSKKLALPPSSNTLEILRRVHTDCGQSTEGFAQSQQKPKATAPTETPTDPSLLARRGRDLSSSANVGTVALRSQRQRPKAKKPKAKRPKRVHPHLQAKEAEPTADPKESSNARVSRKGVSISTTPSGSKEATTKLATPSSRGPSATPGSQGPSATLASSGPQSTSTLKGPSERTAKHPVKPSMNKAGMSVGRHWHSFKKNVLETVSPHSFVRSKVNDIRDAPWLSKEEFAAVYMWLYSNKTELISKGVGRVAAWSTRGKLPVGIDITAHLCEAFLMEMKYNAGNSYQAVSFGFSVAITRFINGLVEAALHRDIGITSAAMKFDIPQWVIDLRHEASHRSLPSVGGLRAGATFCLRWLKQYYWKQYQDIQLMQRPESRAISPAPGGPPSIPLFPKTKETLPAEDVHIVVAGVTESGAMWRLTRGLCNTRAELIDLLTSSTYMELAGYLRKKQLLQFPDHNTSYTLTTPEASDLISFSELQIGSAELAMWKKHLLKACEQNPCFKQMLISALIVVVNSSECEAGLRDYLCSWLCMLMVEQYQVDTEEGDGHGVEVVQIIDDDEQFLPGTLDWLTLLKIAKKHAGYYTYAIVNVLFPRFSLFHAESFSNSWELAWGQSILQHLKSTLAESTREHILYLTTLVTLSDRIGHDSYIPGIRRGTYEQEFRQAKAKLLQSRRSKERGGSLPPAKRAKLEGKGSKSRWSTVADMSQWVKCPLGLMPGQTEISPTLFDLPASLDGPPLADSMATTSTSMILDDKGQGVEEEEEEGVVDSNNDSGIYDTTLIEKIQSQVTIL